MGNSIFVYCARFENDKNNNEGTFCIEINALLLRKRLEIMNIIYYNCGV